MMLTGIIIFPKKTIPSLNNLDRTGLLAHRKWFRVHFSKSDLTQGTHETRKKSKTKKKKEYKRKKRTPN
jgi:hypothetical protein